MPALSCPRERGQRGGTGRTWGWLGPALVFFPLGSLACLSPLRRPPEASGLESQVTRPPPGSLWSPGAWHSCRPSSHADQRRKSAVRQLDTATCLGRGHASHPRGSRPKRARDSSPGRAPGKAWRERETGRHRAHLLCVSSLSLAISCNSSCAGQYRPDSIRRPSERRGKEWR